MGFGYHKLKENAVGAFVFLYCATNFMQNFGPNTTTFVVPGEVFPTRYRSTAHGISAASGKFGAIIAQIIAFKLKDRGGKNAFVPHGLEIFANTSCTVDEEGFEALVEEFRALDFHHRQSTSASVFQIICWVSHSRLDNLSPINGAVNEADLHSLSSEMSKPLNRALETA